ncbi:MAG TPA: DUF885 family protein, partial [Blastocatellia bacterium]|nr:DUF885 family protein [Blastocatellia bacterium]
MYSREICSTPGIQIMRIALTLLVAVLLAAVPVRAADDDATRLAALFADAWEFSLAEDPLLATSVGDNRANDRLPSVTVADLERRDAFARKLLERLATIDRSKLSDTDRVSYDVFRWQTEIGIEDFRRGAWRCTLTGDWGFHMAFAQLPNEVPLATTRDYENYIARLRDYPRYNREQIALLAEGLRAGFTLPRLVLDGYDKTISGHIVADTEKSVFY